MQVRHLPNRDHRNSGVTTLKCASTHVPRFLTGSDPPISNRQLPFRRSIAQAVYTAHRRAAARKGFLTLPSPLAAAGLPCEGVRSLSQRLREDPTSGHHADAFGPTCSASKAQSPNQKPLVVVSVHWSLRCALHHGETRLCISLPFSISFIANIARKRPELNRDKTSFCFAQTWVSSRLRISINLVHFDVKDLRRHSFLREGCGLFRDGKQRSGR